MWTPDEELEATALQVLEAELRHLSDPSASIADPDTVTATASCASLLESIGTLAACDRLGAAIDKVDDVTRAELRARLGALELPDLDDASLRLLENAPLLLTMDESSFDEVAEPVLDALRARDRIELLWMGAEALGVRDALSDEAHASRDSFDALVAPELWQLVPLAARRTMELQWMAPTQRPRFWWRFRGQELAGDALEDRSMRAIVLAVFPEAREHLEAFDAMNPEPQRRPVTLGALFSRRAHARAVGGQTSAFAAGGSPGADEEAILRTSVVEVGRAGSALVIDVLADLAEGAIPELVGPERLVARAVPDTAQRFVIELAAKHFELAGWKLVLPLTAGRVEIPLDGGDAD